LNFGKLERERRECASLTKIMTAYVVLRLMEKFNIDENVLITINADATATIGTTAELQEGDTLTL
jgi:D-alanyl-D-alanine carboxypeptidase